jgi:hypothetical protein
MSIRNIVLLSVLGTLLAAGGLPILEAGRFQNPIPKR